MEGFLPLYMEGQRTYSVFAFAIMCKLQKSGESREQIGYQQPTFFFTPLETHGMEKITAWRRRKISIAMQKKREYYHLIGLSQ